MRVSPEKALSKKEQIHLQECLKHRRTWTEYRNAALINILLYCGLTRSEIVQLRLTDILHDTKSIQAGIGQKRIIPLNTKAYNVLKDWLEIRRLNASPYVFLSQRRQQVTEQAVWNICFALREKCNIPNLTPQVLRNTYLLRLISDQKTPQDIAYLSGITTVSYIEKKIKEKRNDIIHE